MEKYIDRSGLSERDGKGEYADAVFLVTSGEYMALYAANNILRGIHNFDGDVHRRAAGIIYNERKLPDEDGRVSRFAQAVRLPVCGKVPRSHGFAQAEEAHVTLMEFELLVIVNSPGASLIGDHLRKLADTVLKDRPCVILESLGYSQDFDTGYEEAVLELLKQLPGLCFCGGVLGLIHRVVFFTCLIIFSISFEAFTGVILTV